jgi:uncharacterized alkaline shock family protein YloU
MSETTLPSGSKSSEASGSQSSASGTSLDRHDSGESALITDRGTTTIASSVVAKIAGLATQEIPGVQAMGKSVTRTLGALKAKIPGASQATTQGVSVEVGQRQAAVDIDIVCYYGQSIVEITEAIRENVISRIEGMTGFDVVEVNIGVDDLYFDSDDESGSSRVE